MKMKYVLLLALITTAFIMIYLGIANSMLPPALTGFGFILIAVLFLFKDNR